MSSTTWPKIRSSLGRKRTWPSDLRPSCAILPILCADGNGEQFDRYPYLGGGGGQWNKEE